MLWHLASLILLWVCLASDLNEFMIVQYDFLPFSAFNMRLIQEFYINMLWNILNCLKNFYFHLNNVTFCKIACPLAWICRNSGVNSTKTVGNFVTPAKKTSFQSSYQTGILTFQETNKVITSRGFKTVTQLQRIHIRELWYFVTLKFFAKSFESNISMRQAHLCSCVIILHDDGVCPIPHSPSQSLSNYEKKIDRNLCLEQDKEM